MEDNGGVGELLAPLRLCRNQPPLTVRSCARTTWPKPHRPRAISRTAAAYNLASLPTKYKPLQSLCKATLRSCLKCTTFKLGSFIDFKALFPTLFWISFAVVFGLLVFIILFRYSLSGPYQKDSLGSGSELGGKGKQLASKASREV